jgi:hypothetical protein
MTTYEIHDTPTDRMAMALLLERYPDLQVDALAADASTLNVAWVTIAKDLAKCPFEAFNAFEKEFRDQEQALARTQRADRSDSLGLMGDEARPEGGVLAALRRVNELTAWLTEWRHATWEANEIRAGRDPHRTAEEQKRARR